MNLFKKYWGIVLLIIMLGIGLLTFDYYGVSMDEEQQHSIGQITYEYIYGGEKAELNYNNLHDSEKDYGVAFELPLIFIEKIFSQTDLREIYLTRHLLTHIFYLLSAFFCFLLIDLIYKNKLLATIGFLLLIINPCIYGHSFFNSKDIPFMSMFLICFYLSALAFIKKEFIYFMFLGIGIGLLINLRIMGILMFFLVPVFLFIDFIHERKGTGYKFKNIYFMIIFVFTAMATLYISWPYLWGNPVEKFITAFNDMSKRYWEGYVFFNGEMVKATDEPWFYSIAWFGITNPIFYLMAGVFSIVLLIINFCKTPFVYLFNNKERNNLFYLFCFIGPILAVIFFRSVLYDGWRQLYFIYPSFVLLIIYGLNFLFKTKIKLIVAGGFLISFSSVVFFMISNFPFQHIYFNRIINNKPPEYIRKHFELDYWGTSYKQALEYICSHDNSEIIPINSNDYGIMNKLILKPEDRKRIVFVSLSESRYLITNYRWRPNGYVEYKDHELYSIKVMNNSINTIYKLK
jgi:hypothetical protein